MKWIILEAVLLGSSALMLDAFFAHGLKTYLGPQFSETVLHALTTASRYQLIASLFLLILLLLYRAIPTLWIVASQIFVSLGVVFFCFSIYLRHLFGFDALVNLAPIGGILFMLSFIALLPTIILI
jgi:uncharacterized membrane protein YgdD (TMEM256/DUF423 family)